MACPIHAVRARPQLAAPTPSQWYIPGHEAVVLILPGLYSSGPDHWQTLWKGPPELRRVEQAAQAHRVTVTEMIGRYLRSLRGRTGAIHLEVETISGLIPPEVDARAEYREQALGKRRLG